MSNLDCVVIEPQNKANASVIWLHGLGANGHDFEPVVPMMSFADDTQVRFVFPHAPQQPVTINGAMVMPAWYDILDMSVERKVDVTQLRQSADAIEALIEAELDKGVDSSRIILAGFSQGGAVAYETALRFDKPLGGLIAMSTYFATHDSIALSDANRGLDILVMHGSQDPVVVPELGDKACQYLKAFGFSPTFKSYPMPHAVCAEQIADINAWLVARLRTVGE
ncbi:dienelactone hydrolase family protein [Thalassotalea ponticola]|uniref:alpha/beta hydrolase n=1 Tax=Thalassotalea ponticola TaxID=1523392 RepID=UPI0025B541F1|nr:dienelactone hydrolase family protein [Thalassotalea ponticola]MDN3653380.1 dienelactone hydrolase family protein [Thalassotalea ponticola]